jgi:D-amino-acid dehydrogenase
VRLGLYSRETLQALRRDTGITYDHRTQGILHFYTTQKEFDAALKPAEQMRELGCERRVVSADEAVKIEPALSHIRSRLAGATYTAEDESGDANLFAREVVRLCHDRGVTFLMSHTVTALRVDGNVRSARIEHVEATDAEGRFQRIRGDAYVLALGSVSPLFVAPLGIRLPIYPAKGYSVTMPVKDEAKANQVSLTDDEFKLVYSRLGNRLRIAGVRCEAIVRRVDDVFPGAGDGSQAQFWTGLRPATPSNVPLIGKTRLPNLYLNTGHGTLGWTHACGSGKSIARIVSGLAPEVDFAFTTASHQRQTRGASGDGV